MNDPETNKKDKATANSITAEIINAGMDVAVEATMGAIKATTQQGTKLAGQIVEDVGEVAETVGKTLLETAEATADLAGDVAEGAGEIAVDILSNIDI